MSGRFEIYLGNAQRVEDDRLWYWRCVTKTGRIIVEGKEGYSNILACRAALEIFRHDAVNKPVVVTPEAG